MPVPQEAPGYLKQTLNDKLIWPDVANLDLLFVDVKPWEGSGKAAHEGRVIRKQAGYRDTAVGPYLSVGGRDRKHKAFSVLATDALVEAVSKNLFTLPGDNMTFKAIYHNNGYVLVVVEYSLILGGRWIAYVTEEEFHRKFGIMPEGG